MTTSTYTSANVSGGMSIWNPFRAPWPDPEASIRTSPGWLCPVKGKSCWSLQGPALRAYNIIKDKIKQCLRDRERDLYDDADESFVPHSIDCLMVGSTEARARPYIIISCGQESFSKKVMKVIKGTAWWNEFIEEHKGFGGFLLLRYAPRRVADADERTQMSFVYSSHQNSSLCGMPIFFATGQLGSLGTCAPQQATLGNIIYLDDMPFGLTVAHPLVEQQGDVPEQYTQHADPVVYMDDSGDESSLQSELAWASTTDEARSAPSIQSTESVQSRLLPGSPSLVGQVVCRSEGTPSDVVDWALVVLNADYFKTLERHHAYPSNKSSEQHSPSPRQTSLKEDIQGARRDLRATLGRNVFRETYSSVPVAKPRHTLCPTSNAIPVLLPDGEHGFREGLLNADESLVCLAGNRQYLSLHSVMLEEELRPGTCGSWAFDSEGNWCGHIVAGLPGTNIAYLACAPQILSDIQKRTGIVPSISPGPQSHQCTSDMLTFGPKSLFTDAGLYACTLYAASAGDLEKVVQMLLNAGADVNAQGQYFRNALQAASKRGYEKVVQMLLKAGADVNAQGEYSRSALQAASQRGYEKVVQILLNAGADVNAQGDFISALQVASGGGHEKVVQILLDAGADVNAQGMYSGSALHAASGRGHEKVVQTLLNAGADVNTQGRHPESPLYVASERGHEKVVQILLDAGAGVNAQGGYFGSALQAASRGGYEKVVQILLDAGADVNAQGDVGSALHLASEGGHEKVVQMLLNAGADDNTQGGRYDKAPQRGGYGNVRKGATAHSQRKGM